MIRKSASNFGELSTIPSNDGYNAILSRNEPVQSFPQYGSSRDLASNHCNPNMQHSLFFMRSDLHIIFKNVQSIRSDQRILALDVDLNAITLTFAVSQKHGQAKTKSTSQFLAVMIGICQVVHLMDIKELASS